jgi:predicted peptidase
VSSHPLHSTPSSDDDDEDEEEEERIDGLPHFCLESFELDEFRDYIVGTSFGVARGLAADFDSVALIVDGIHTRTVCF